MHDRILVPVKLQHAKNSRNLIQKAVSMARGEDAEIVVLSIFDRIDNNLKKLPEDHLPEIEAVIAKEDTRGVKIRCMIRTGAPHRQIPRVAAELGCDLIIMNSHNPRITDYIIGSTTGHVVSHATCDVLVVRQNGG
ncbi:universal stress protein [Rhodobacteraceae bacterium]|nr:universal stress protein [Paracoccaceae bacterium]